MSAVLLKRIPTLAATNSRLVSNSALRSATLINNASTSALHHPSPTASSSSHRLSEAESVVEEHDIVIVGGGPTGLTLASALASSPLIAGSHKITLLEASPLEGIEKWELGPEEYSNRVSSITAENVAFFDRIGVWPHVDTFRTRAIEEMQVWDGLTDARIAFASPLSEPTPDAPYESISPMATLVENLNLQRGLLRYLREGQKGGVGVGATGVGKGVELIDSTRVAGVSEGVGGWPVVKLAAREGVPSRSLRARLLIGADGYNSPVRLYSGIESFGWAYNAWGVVGSVQVAPSFMDNGMNTAWQRFLPQGPIAFLPMSDSTASLVWSTTPPIAKAIKALPIELLPALINCAFAAPYTLLEPFLNLLTASPPTSTEVLASELLDLTLSLEQSFYSVDKIPDPLPPSIISVQPGSIATFPLKMSHADTYLGAPKKGRDLRTVLVGDAAHTIHPMAGQGFNMGVGDVRALVDTLEQTVRDGGDVGAYNTLRTYPRTRYIQNHAVISATDHLNSLYTSNLSAVIWARSTGLEVLNELDFVKTLIMGGAGATAKGGKMGVWGNVAEGIEGVGKAVGFLKAVGGMAGMALAQSFGKMGNGGLDTSCILAWLIDEGFEVIAFMGNVGQEEDFAAAEAKAYKIGAKKFFLVDLQREFVEHLIYPAVQANAIYEGVYLLGTSLARPVIARAMMDIVVQEDCQYVSHGCTGKGNDQVRFELAFYALQPDIKVIAPWRDPVFFNRFAGRNALLDYAAEKGIHVFQTAAKPWSTDENLFHISYEAGILEDPDTTPPSDMWKLTQSLENAPKTAERISINFTKGIPTSLLIHPADQGPVPSTAGKEVTDSVEIFLTLNALARKHGIGRCDIVENRFIGVKSRGCYESPGATILRKAHMDLEGLTMDRNVRALRDNFVTVELSKILYNGYWFSPEREFVQSCMEQSQKTVNGRVRLALLCGNVIVEGRHSDTEALYDAKQSSMDELGGFSPEATSGFITIESIRLRKWAEARLAKGETVKPESVYASRK